MHLLFPSQYISSLLFQTFSVVVLCEHLRPRRPERVAPLLDLFRHLPLVRLLLHQVLVLLSLLIRLEETRLEVNFLPDGLPFLQKNLLLLLLQLDLHVEHFAHFHLLLLAALFFLLLHSFLLCAFFHVEISNCCHTVGLFQEFVCNVGHYLIRLGSPVVCLVRLWFEYAL